MVFVPKSAAGNVEKTNMIDNTILIMWCTHTYNLTYIVFMFML